MDQQVRTKESVSILVELRPALDKHAGIPQQTRLLFRGLALADELRVEGLIQSSTHALTKGLPATGRRLFRPLPRHRQINRMSRMIVALEQKFLRSHFSTAWMMARRLLGGAETLTRFEASQFRDFIWRRLFARTLPSSDFDLVTSTGFRIAQVPWTAMHIGGLVSSSVGCALYPRLNTRGIDVVIAETPYPGVVSNRTALIVRYHDAIPLLMPHTISERRHHQAFHYRALRCNVENGAYFVCVSNATRKDLLSIYPQLEMRSRTIYNMVSHEYFDETSSPLRVPDIVRTRVNARVARVGKPEAAARMNDADATMQMNYLLMVSTIEPRKNHLTLLSAWERLRMGEFPNLKLVVVGSLGWHHYAIVRKLLPWVRRNDIFMLEEVPAAELRLLYKHARATVCPSLAEGFDLPGIEAMMSGGAVIASDIPVHREVFGDGAAYFNPYSAEHLYSAVRSLLGPEGLARRQELVEIGRRVASRYTAEVILPCWKQLVFDTSRERHTSELRV